MQQQIDHNMTPHTEDEPFPLLDYLQLLWFRRRLIVVITLLVAAIGYIQVNQMRNIYTAQSSILIGIQQGQVNGNMERFLVFLTGSGRAALA